MDIKPVPTTQVANSVKETGEEKRQARGQDPKQQKPAQTKTPKAQAEVSTQEQESTPEAADAALRASQPMDTQTTLDLLTHPPKAPNAAKFPTPPKTYGPPSGAKKLNRSA